MDIKNGNGKKQTIDALKHTISQWVDNCKYSPGNPDVAITIHSFEVNINYLYYNN